MKPQPNLIPRFNIDYDFDDFLYAIKSIFSNVDLSDDILKILFGNKKFFFTNNGRSALYIILKSLDLPKGSKVGVPLYSCTVVFDSIIRAGYIPYFIDIDFDTYSLDPNDLENKINELSAVIIIHTFGFPAEMDKIKNIAKALPIIEDCAHSILSEYKFNKTGTIGNASFFSLEKYISSGGGGMIVLNDNNLAGNVKREISMLSSHSKLSEIKHSIFRYIYSFLYHKPWFGGFAFQIGSSIELKVDIVNKKKFDLKKIRKSDFSLFLRKLKYLEERIEIQRKNSILLLKELTNTEFILPYESKDTKFNYFLFPIIFSDKEKRDAACENLRKMGIDTAKLFNMTPAVARKFYNYKNDCPVAEQLAERVLTIPNYYTLNKKELMKIADIIKKI